MVHFALRITIFALRVTFLGKEYSKFALNIMYYGKVAVFNYLLIGFYLYISILFMYCQRTKY